MKCEKCGKEVKNGKFCPDCGVELKKKKLYTQYFYHKF